MISRISQIEIYLLFVPHDQKHNHIPEKHMMGVSMLQVFHFVKSNGHSMQKKSIYINHSPIRGIIVRLCTPFAPQQCLYAKPSPFTSITKSERPQIRENARETLLKPKPSATSYEIAQLT